VCVSQRAKTQDDKHRAVYLRFVLGCRLWHCCSVFKTSQLNKLTSLTFLTSIPFIPFPFQTADNVLAANSGSGGGRGHAKLVAELNMLRLASNAYGLQKQGTYIPEGADASEGVGGRTGAF